MLKEELFAKLVVVAAIVTIITTAGGGCRGGSKPRLEAEQPYRPDPLIYYRTYEQDREIQAAPPPKLTRVTF